MAHDASEMKRRNALEMMHSAAALGFYTSEVFGIGSVEHEATLAPYQTAKAQYEAVCRDLSVAAYATYDLD